MRGRLGGGDRSPALLPVPRSPILHLTPTSQTHLRYFDSPCNHIPLPPSWTNPPSWLSQQSGNPPAPRVTQHACSQLSLTRRQSAAGKCALHGLPSATVLAFLLVILLFKIVPGHGAEVLSGFRGGRGLGCAPWGKYTGWVSFVQPEVLVLMAVSPLLLKLQCS